MRPALVHALFLALISAGCRGPGTAWPFPPVEPGSDEDVIAVLRDRTPRPGALQAVLSMSFESPDRSGVADAVVSWREPGSIRMTAFKDMLVASRGIFDLVLTPGSFSVILEGEGTRERHDGPSAELPRLHPGFRAFWALREAMFLPGLLAPAPPPRVARRPGALSVLTRTPSGLPLEWRLDPATLAVVSAVIEAPGGAITIRYGGYRQVEGLYFPDSFQLMDPGARVEVSGLLQDLDLHPDLGPEAFTLEP